jgi:hypothetical protein
MLTATEVEQLAARVLAARFPDAEAGFAAGSIVRGQGTPGSDLDLVVLYERLPNARREAFRFEGLPVDVFIHDGETLRWTFQADLDAGKPAYLTMAAEGRIVGPRQDEARGLQARARELLRAGPPPLSDDQREQFRFLITDRIGDLRDRRSAGEWIATGAWLYLVMADFILRSRGEWAATAKWIPRTLATVDPALEAAFARAFDDLFTRGDPAALIAFAEETLAPFGGLLFEGYEAQSPPSARLKEP